MPKAFITTILNDDNAIEKVKVNSVGADFNRFVDVEIGKEYIIKPLHKLKLRNRDRKVLVTKFLTTLGNDLRVQVKFLDNNKAGRVLVEELDYI